MSRGYPVTVSVIVLARGLYTKSGTNRLLEQIGERTMIGHVVYECQTSKAKQVIVLVGPDSEKVRSELKDYRCETVLDENLELGETGSIKEGLSKVRSDADAVILVPGDISVVDRTMINNLIRKYSACYAPIVAKRHRGGPLRPILFDKNLLGELGDAKDFTDGIKSLVQRYGSRRQFVRLSDARILRLGMWERH